MTAITSRQLVLRAIVAGFKEDQAYRKTVEDHAEIMLRKLEELPQYVLAEAFDIPWGDMEY